MLPIAMRVPQVPIQVNPSKPGGAIPDEATLDGSNLAAKAAKRAIYRVNHFGTKMYEGELRAFEALAAKRNQTQGELIRGLILVSQLEYSAPHHSMKSEAYRDLFVTDTTNHRHAPESEQNGTHENCN